jgi:hypothetical protein
MTRYIVTVPNPKYNGKAAGVRFQDGRAVVDDLTIDKSLGHELPEVITIFKNLGYNIQEVEEPTMAKAIIPAMVAPPAKSPARKKKQPA